MHFGLINLLKLLGSLGLFLFGMKLMSESLQRVAGDRMRTILAAMTSNKFKGVLTGFVITAIIQSSSATTVMLVSFVNAGLITLAESIGVVMGTNIGTTVTAWLISVLGFKVNITHLVLPLVGLSLPFLFSKDNKKSNWGGIIIGFAIIFIGLDFLQSSSPDINSNPGMLHFFIRYSNLGFLSILIFLFVGTGLTMLIQSSSAVMALTLVMCFNGWISFEMAASMVLGQNIGTTITANLAALVANTSAKRTAMAHLLFNLVGVILVLIVFKPFLHLVDLFIQKTGLTSPFPQEGQTAKQTAEAMPIALSIFHTVFNLLNTLILIWFVPTIVKAVTFLIKQRDTEEDFKLQFIHTGLLSTAELSLIQAKKEIHIYAHRIMKMFYYAKELVLTTSNKKYNKLFEKVKKCEEISDNLEIEIATYLTKITSEAVSSSGTEDINAMLSIISNLESIGDSFNTIANAVNRKKDAKISFTSELEKNLDTLLNIAEKMLTKMVKGIENNDGKTDHSEIDLLINKLKKTSLKLQTEHYKNLRKGIYKIKTGIIYSDICSELSKLCEYVHNISRIIIPHHEEKSELELTSS